MLVRSAARGAAAVRPRSTPSAAPCLQQCRSIWSEMPMGPPDPILGLTDAFNKDSDKRKVSLGVGAYRGDDGKPYILETVRKAEQLVISKNMNHEYAGIAGVPNFVKLSLEFAYGTDSQALKDKRVAGVQTLSGTGACRVVGELLGKFQGAKAGGGRPPIYVPNPTWGNHIPIFNNAGMEVRKYRYYDPKTVGLDFEGLIADVEQAPKGSAFLLHACAHNPTGVDPTLDQWRQISQAMKAQGHVVFFDCAYQGFASGDAEHDAAALRMFVADGHNVALGQSFAKNFGLYGERIGALSVVCADLEEAARVESQLKLVIRPMYSNPPVHGARLVSEILSDAALRAEWAGECRGMAERITAMRVALRESLEKRGSARDWSHITDQIGMFCYTGLTTEEVLKIRADRHVYFTGDGRISMAGLTSTNVDYVGESIFQVAG
ncbi:aspartate aminotransferase [Tribonema minus]|uniref:Aspartate aminotransferase n=1 Tax=Tribonema minus TaxID=303371 RepID=A0A835Z2I3_9STRA|nr:aspartate aminotransferase [Tribonema minus]